MTDIHRKMFEEFMKKVLEQPIENPETYKLIGKELSNDLIEDFQRKYSCSKDEAVKIIVEGAMFQEGRPMDPVRSPEDGE